MQENQLVRMESPVKGILRRDDQRPHGKWLVAGILFAVALVAIHQSGRPDPVPVVRKKTILVDVLPSVIQPPPPPVKVIKKAEPDPPLIEPVIVPTIVAPVPPPGIAPPPVAVTQSAVVDPGDISGRSGDDGVPGGMIGGTGSGGSAWFVFNSYAQRYGQHIRSHLARSHDAKSASFKVVVQVWLHADGSVQRVELASTTGDPGLDATLRAALQSLPDLAIGAPEGLPQPLRLSITNRVMG